MWEARPELFIGGARLSVGGNQADAQDISSCARPS